MIRRAVADVLVCALIGLAVFLVLLLADVAGAARRPVAHLQLWLCVHKNERSAWNDPGRPYWGGLQLGEWFLGHYPHPAGTPDEWTPRVQMLVAENAYRIEHYSVEWLRGQWPPSRGRCF